jgi:hypothetical protein
MAMMQDLYSDGDGTPLGRYVLTMRGGTGGCFAGIQFDDAGKAVVGPDQVTQLRRLILNMPDAFDVEPEDVDAIRAVATEADIENGLSIGAAWAVAVLGAKEAAARSFARADQLMVDDEAAQLIPKRDIRVKGTGLGAQLVTYAEAAAAHEARVRATGIYELIWELRCYGCDQGGAVNLWAVGKAKLAEMLLAAHGFPTYFPRYWQPPTHITKENHRSAEAGRHLLPYDLADMMVAPSEDLTKL